MNKCSFPDDVTEENEAVSVSEIEVYSDSGPVVWEGQDAASDSLRVTVKPNFDKSGSKYGVSTSTASRSYSSKRTHRFSSRTYTSTREAKASGMHSCYTA